MNITIREAREADIPRILEIYAPYVKHTTISFEYEVPSPESFTERFRQVTSRFPWLVCEADGLVVGYAYGSPAFERAAYQWNADLSVYLDEAYTGMGLGGKLYDALLPLLKKQGIRRVYALVTSENFRSMNWHTAMGFHEVARFPRTGYKLGIWLDVIWYEKVLIPCVGEPFPVTDFPCCRESDT